MRPTSSTALTLKVLTRLPLAVLLLAFITRPCAAESDTGERAAAYLLACDALRVEAVATGQVAYRQVLQAAYGEDAPIADYLRATVQWQEQNRGAFTFLSDYQSHALSTQLAEVAPVRNPKLGSTLIGRYDPRAHSITVATIASGHAVAHESGHALQRKALLDRRSWQVQNEQFDPLLTLWEKLSNGPASQRLSARRLRYLSSQDELEVRLQDLNRLHAIALGGGPIQTPRQALLALAYMDVPLAEPNVSNALRGSAWEMTPAAFAQLKRKATAAPRLPNVETHFEDAYELRRLQRLIERLEPALWEATLKKILFEAPGHL